MKFGIAVLLVAASFAPVHSVLSRSAFSRGSGRTTHPVEGVISTLKRLREQVVAEGQDEEITYARFAKWCDDSKRTLQKSVAESKASMESLQNEVSAKTAQNETLTEQLASLLDEISKYQGANAQSGQSRLVENDRYREANTDFGATILAFENAIQALNEAKPDASAFVQELVGKVPAMALLHMSDRQVSMLMEAGGNSSERPDLQARGDYGKHTQQYSFKSDNIIELLKELKASFEDQRVAATKAETNAVNAHGLSKDARDRAIQAARDTHSEQTTELGGCQEALNAAEVSLSDAQGDLSVDSSALSDTATQCNMKKTEWEERSSTRAREIVAIDEGVKILAKVTGVRTAAPENPGLPVRDGSADFMQQAAVLLSLQTDPRARVVTLLKSEAARLHSKAFQRFAAEFEARVNGPFDEVNNMIQKMIFRLNAEQKSDDEHKHWCDLELEKTNASMINKEDKLTELGLKVSEAQSTVAELLQQISDANKDVSSINGFIAEATDIRNIGKKENAVAVADAKAAQAAIAKAIGVLEDFYKSTGMIAKESWEFVQKGSEPVALPESPASWDSAVYAGGADPKNQESGVIAILERIASDFSTMLASTEAQEATDENNYQEQMKAEQIERARLVKEAEMKTQQKQRLSEEIASLEKKQAHTKNEKAATEQYLADLQPACVEGDSTYDDRAAARLEEIEALKEAQVILTDAFKGNSTEPVNDSATFLEMPEGRSFLAAVKPSY